MGILDAPGYSRGAADARFAALATSGGAWSNTATAGTYARGAVVNYLGNLYQRTTAHTSTEATFVTGNWVRVGRAPVDQQRRTALRAARAALAARSLNVAMFGDSITDGYNATAFGKRWAELFTASVRKRLGLSAGGLGFLTIQRSFPADGVGWPFVNASGAGNASYAFLGRSAQINNTTSPLTITAPLGTTGVDIVMVGYSGSPQMVYTIDGAGSTTFTSTTGSLTPGYVAKQIRGLDPASSHTIVVNNNAAGASFIEGVFFYAGDETTGVRSMPAGLSGATSTSWLAANSGVQLGVLKTYLPRLVTIELGVNDYTTGAASGQTVTSAQLKTNLQSLITQIRGYYTAAGDQGPSIALLGLWQRGNAANATLAEPWENYLQAYHQVADADANQLVTVFNVRDIVNPTTDPTKGPMYGIVDTDQIHPTNTGHQFMADMLTDFVLAP